MNSMLPKFFDRDNGTNGVSVEHASRGELHLVADGAGMRSDTVGRAWYIIAEQRKTRPSRIAGVTAVGNVYRMPGTNPETQQVRADVGASVTPAQVEKPQLELIVNAEPEAASPDFGPEFDYAKDDGRPYEEPSAAERGRRKGIHLLRRHDDATPIMTAEPLAAEAVNPALYSNEVGPEGAEASDHDAFVEAMSRQDVIRKELDEIYNSGAAA